MSVRLDRPMGGAGLVRPGSELAAASQQPAQSQPPPARSEAPEPPEKEQRYSPELLDRVGRELSEFFEVVNTRIALSVNQELGRVVIKIIDNETNEVLKQIPPEQMIAMAERIQDLLGLLVDERA